MQIERKKVKPILLVFAFVAFKISLFSQNVFADQIVHQFKSPSFSGVGTSSHYLTIDEQEKTRRDELSEDIESALKEAEREADNTTLAKFLRNLESRIYSQLSRDIAESLFNSESGGTGGSIVLEGSTITFVNDGVNIILTIIDADGNLTEIVIPVGIFGICSEDCGI
jgi:hypothetical protein|tara:strand:- start:21 stop:524 length:504 start_codon:yes stop_codon:yes gene_type:complete